MTSSNLVGLSSSLSGCAKMSHVNKERIKELLKSGIAYSKIAKILDEARLIYHQKKAILEKEKTLEEFAKLYQEHPDFEELESQYYIEVDSEKEIIKNHIQSNLSMFAMVTD